MLWNIKDLDDYAIRATDGDLGHVTDFYFDDLTWVIRYLVVDTGTWLTGRSVLISPISVGHIDWVKEVLPVSITKEQVKNSPDIDTAKPVSRQHEMEFLGYYDYPFYWGGAGLWDGQAYPGMMTADSGRFPTPPYLLKTEQGDVPNVHTKIAQRPQEDPRLRSSKTVMSYRIAAVDGDIGHIKGMLVDEETWAIRYFIVDTGSWWIGHRMLVPTQWIKEVRWTDDTVAVDVTRQAMQNAPQYDAKAPLDRQAELAIHQHYGRSGYWMREAEREEVLSPD